MKNVIFFAALLALAGMILVSAPAGAQAIGDLAPEFSLQNLQGGYLSSDNIFGSKVVLLWFTTFDDTSRNSLAELQSLYQNLPMGSVEFAAISVNGDDITAARELMTQFGVSFPVLADPTGDLCLRLTHNYLKGATPLKNLFLIGKNKKVELVEPYPGIPVAELEKKIKDLLK